MIVFVASWFWMCLILFCLKVPNPTCHREGRAQDSRARDHPSCLHTSLPAWGLLIRVWVTSHTDRHQHLRGPWIPNQGDPTQGSPVARTPTLAWLRVCMLIFLPSLPRRSQVTKLWQKPQTTMGIHQRSPNEPAHEIMVLLVLCKFILQTRMRSHPVGLDVWFLVGPFVYFHTLCVRTAKALARLRGCAVLPEPLLVTYVISTIISWAGSKSGINEILVKLLKIWAP